MLAIKQHLRQDSSGFRVWRQRIFGQAYQDFGYYFVAKIVANIDNLRALSG